MVNHSEVSVAYLNGKRNRNVKIATGVKKAIYEYGFLGIFTGGLTATAGGITAAIVISYIVSLFAKSKSQ